MLKMDLQKLPENHFGSWAQKCSRWASKGILGAISGAGPRNNQNGPPGASWEPFGELGLEMAKMDLQRCPGGHFQSWAAWRS